MATVANGRVSPESCICLLSIYMLLLALSNLIISAGSVNFGRKNLSAVTK